MQRAEEIPEREPSSDDSHVPGERVPLTRQGQERLSDRLRRLEERVLPDLLRSLEDSKRNAHVDIDYQRAIDEMANLAYALRWAVTTDDLAADPGVVELGDLVRVVDDDGTTDEVAIVHPIEAPLDDIRISYRSPLAKALLGRAVGEKIRVRTPSGTRRCTILSIARLGSASRQPPR